MTVTQVEQAMGAWSVQLSEQTPREILDQLDYFGHIAITPGRINPSLMGDGLLTAARFVGPMRTRSGESGSVLTLSGFGMAMWLGDDDEKGPVIETRLAASGATFAASIAAVLASTSAVTAGTITAVAGSISFTYQWITVRDALNAICAQFSTPAKPVSWRVNGDGTLDAGPVSTLYGATPTAIVTPQQRGRDLLHQSIAGTDELTSTVDDYTTRVVLIPDNNGGAAVGTANAGTVPYVDVHGNAVKVTRVVSQDGTLATTANTAAATALAQWATPAVTVQLSSSAYDVRGIVAVGGYVYAWDPINQIYDTTQEIMWRGQPINPMVLRVTELDWPVEDGYTVAFRRGNGTWLDLTNWYLPETGDTNIIVGPPPSVLTPLALDPVSAISDLGVPGLLTAGNIYVTSITITPTGTSTHTGSQVVNTPAALAGTNFYVLCQVHTTVPLAVAAGTSSPGANSVTVNLARSDGNTATLIDVFFIGQ